MIFLFKIGWVGVAVAAVAGCANFIDRGDNLGKQEYSTREPARTTEKMVLNMPFDKAELTAEHKTELKEFLKKMRAKSRAGRIIGAVVVTTHTDSIGALSYNMKISEQLAERVKEYLVNVEHIDSSLIFWEGKGPKQPLPVTKFCEDEMRLKQRIDCLAPNRRVTIEFVGTAMPQSVSAENPASHFIATP